MSRSYAQHKALNGRMGCQRHFNMKPYGKDDYSYTKIGKTKFFLVKGKVCGVIGRRMGR